MAIETIERERSQDLSQVKSEAQIAPAILGAQTLNLNSSTAELSNPWHVEESNRLTVQANLDSGAWAKAEVEVRGSIDNANWTVLKKLTGIGFTKDIEITDYTFIQIRVSKVEGAAGVARFYGYGKVVVTPFEVTNDPLPTLTSLVGEKRVWSIDTEANEALGMLIDVGERIQQQLSLVTGVYLDPGDRLY